MVHRLVALVLTAAISGMPLSLALCHVECAHAEASQPVHHSCHESSEPAAVALTAAPHGCGHADEVPVGLERAPQTIAAPVAVVAAVAWHPQPTQQHVAFERVAFADTSPPETARPNQLRV